MLKELTKEEQLKFFEIIKTLKVCGNCEFWDPPHSFPKWKNSKHKRGLVKGVKFVSILNQLKRNSVSFVGNFLL